MLFKSIIKHACTYRGSWPQKDEKESLSLSEPWTRVNIIDSLKSSKACWKFMFLFKAVLEMLPCFEECHPQLSDHSCGSPLPLGNEGWGFKRRRCLGAEERSLIFSLTEQVYYWYVNNHIKSNTLKLACLLNPNKHRGVCMLQYVTIEHSL